MYRYLNFMRFYVSQKKILSGRHNSWNSVSLTKKQFQFSIKALSNNMGEKVLTLSS